MIKVEGPKGPSSIQTRKTGKAGKASGPGNFSVELDRATGPDDSQLDEAGSVDSGAGIVGIQGVFAAQSVAQGDDAPSFEDRQRRAKRGVEILDRLEEIRRGFLLGTIPKDKLAELARIVREKRERGADAVISRLLDEIELRAEVELAKLGRR